MGEQLQLIDHDANVALVDHASRMLQEAKSLDEIKFVRDRAVAARTYAKAAKMGLELQNRAAEVKLRAERKAGRVLSRLQLRGGDRRSKGRRARLKLEQLGINRDESKRWQLIASVPNREFEKYITDKNCSCQEITAAELIRIARRIKAAKKTAGDDPHPAPAARYRKQPSPETYLSELTEHRRLLAEILRPIYELGDPSSLRPGERRAVGHLLREIESCLSEFERYLKRLNLGPHTPPLRDNPASAKRSRV